MGPASHVYQWIYVIVFELKRLERLQQGEQQWAALQGNCPTINGNLKLFQYFLISLLR